MCMFLYICECLLCVCQCIRVRMLVFMYACESSLPLWPGLLQSMARMAKAYHELIKEENELDAEKFALANVGKINAKKRLEKASPGFSH